MSKGGHLTRTHVSDGSRTRQIWFRTSPAIPFLQGNTADLWAPPTLLAAMRRGGRLVFTEPVSEDRRSGMEQIQDLMTSWFPERMQRVEIEAPQPDSNWLRAWRESRRSKEQLRNRGSIACFTGGVDSFYTLMQHPEVDAVVWAAGLDIPLAEKRMLARVRRQNRESARQAGVGFVTFRTNLHAYLRQSNVWWGKEGHGTALATMGMLLSPLFHTLLIPSTHSAEVDVQWGSHRLLDPLWSTSRMRIVHDGGVINRAGKIIALADHVPAQQSLRICYSQFQVDNCGKCMKCLRTMALLAGLDRLESFPTFPALDLDALAAVELKRPNEFLGMRDILKVLEDSGRHPEIADAVRASIAGSAARDPLNPANAVNNGQS
ncbi:MAG: hypothetical protein HZY75_15120 [Nocardioidaceae bacterium]|nr:MAG: hypothetical protein HZY75_15120 [Nocardioidaceae bacterium]